MVQIIIKLDEQGIVGVEGTVNQGVVALGMLEVAKLKLANHFAAIEQELKKRGPGIVAASAGDIPPATPFRG